MEQRRPRKWRSIVSILLAVFGILAAAIILRARAFDGTPLPPSLASTGRLPVTLPDGRHVPLVSILKPGIPTVINLWASWCGPCRSEGPHLAKLRRQFGKDRLNLILLNVRDSYARPDDHAAFLAESGLPSHDYAVLADDDAKRMTALPDNLVPRTLIFDHTGAPVATITGYKPMALRRIAGFIE